MKPNLTDEELQKRSLRIIQANDAYYNLPHKLCPLHGLCRDNGSHADCRLSAVSWWVSEAEKNKK